MQSARAETLAEDIPLAREVFDEAFLPALSPGTCAAEKTIFSGPKVPTNQWYLVMN